jgi:hypothetical protein
MHTFGHGGEKEANMRRLAIRPTMSTRLVRIVLVLGTAGLLAALAAAPAAAHAERKAGSYSFVVGFGDEPAYAGAPNSLQVIISRDGRPATDLAGKLGKLKAHLYYGGKVDSTAEMLELPLAPHFGEGWGTPGDYRSFFIPTQPGGYTVHLNGTLGTQRVNLAIPSGPDTFSDVNDPAKSAFPAVKDPTTAQLAQRLDREATRLNGAVAAATAAQREAEDAAGQARMLALGALLVGVVGLIVGALAWGRRTAPQAARPDAVLTGAGKV